jgi:hypothetical protein
MTNFEHNHFIAKLKSPEPQDNKFGQSLSDILVRNYKADMASVSIFAIEM